ncbi:7213_t:CDS:2 [Entrophospora sp. SA101]|nr:7213_t:CDS:2 [Entrophospora sp. SA101]
MKIYWKQLGHMMWLHPLKILYFGIYIDYPTNDFMLEILIVDRKYFPLHRVRRLKCLEIPINEDSDELFLEESEIHSHKVSKHGVSKHLIIPTYNSD